jgi:NADP-reducing hydrogenase subunit HndA
MVRLPDTPEHNKVRDFVANFRGDPGSLIKVLHFSQGVFGYLPPEIIGYVAQELGVPPSHVYGVVTFYNFFRTEPIGEYEIRVCLGTACHVKGGKDVLETLCQRLKVKVGGTTKDQKFTVNTVRCVGACGLAPVIMVGEDVYGRLSPQKAWNIVKGYYEREALSETEGGS